MVNHDVFLTHYRLCSFFRWKNPIKTSLKPQRPLSLPLELNGRWNRDMIKNSFWKPIFFLYRPLLIYNSAKSSGRGVRYYEKNHDKPYMAKKAIEYGTQGRENKVSIRDIDLTGSNLMPTLDKYLLDKIPPSPLGLWTEFTTIHQSSLDFIHAPPLYQ